jgi:Leucine-rich repeat (LRR) protein
MSSLPAEIGACAELQELWCNFNQLSSLPAELGACAALYDLYCTNNQLSSLPAELGTIPNLWRLICDDNPFVEGAPTTIEALREELGRHTKRAVVAG